MHVQCTLYAIGHSAPNCAQCTHAHQQMVCKAIYEHLYLLSFCTFCTFRIFDGKDAGREASILHSGLLVTYFASLRPSSPSQHHFHFQEVLKRFTKSSRQKSSVMWSVEKLGIGHFSNRILFGSDTLQRKRLLKRLLVICLCCHCCCLCVQMAFRSSRKLVHNVQVFQVELPPKLWPHPRQSLSRSIYPTLPIRGTCCNLERI